MDYATYVPTAPPDSHSVLWGLGGVSLPPQAFHPLSSGWVWQGSPGRSSEGGVHEVRACIPWVGPSQ